MNQLQRLAESARIDSLTLIEAAIICGWAKGWNNREVAAELGMSVFTVKGCATRIRDKLGVHTRAGAVGAWTRYAG